MTKNEALTLKQQLADVQKMLAELQTVRAERAARTQKRTPAAKQPKPPTKRAQKAAAKLEKRDALKQARKAIYAQHPHLHPGKRPLIGYTHEQLVAAGTRNAAQEIKNRAQMRELLGKKPINFDASKSQKAA